MSRVDDLLKKYSNYQPSPNTYQQETYTSTITKVNNAYDRYNVAPQNLSVGNLNNIAQTRFGTDDLIDRSNNLTDTRGNRLGTQELINASSNLRGSRKSGFQQNQTDFNSSYKQVETKANTPPASSNNIDALVTIVARGAEMERLQQKIRFQSSNPIRQVTSNYNRDDLLNENKHLKEELALSEHDFAALEEENYKMKERENQLKNRLNELNEENKRLQALQMQKGKGGAWCC